MPRPRPVAAAVIAIALLAGCASVDPQGGTGSTQTSAAPSTDTTDTTGSPGSVSPPAADVRARLAGLQIDDHPAPGEPYRRDLFPTWLDIDHDGCDAREQALVAQSRTPAQVSFPGCEVVAGDWVSPYDGVETSSPGDLDADHLVPLENVHESGGWRWDAVKRVAYANDQAVLVMVSARSNRSKGARTPADWRPPLESYWCTYATRWVQLKEQWQLTATTRERDALGQMLDTCPTG
ncbi:MAG: GmrSD restriction endonuclease domain-containing protein [Acidimicrobiales bacterium]